MLLWCRMLYVPHPSRTATSKVLRGRRFQVVASARVIRPVHVSRNLAASRTLENANSTPIFNDVYSELLVKTGPQGNTVVDASPVTTACDIIATKYLDDTLLTALGLTNINTINEGDYYQVVLLGDGMDTRAYRLLLPSGTAVFQVSSAEVHELAEAVLAQAGAKVQRVCLFRRVNADLQGGADFTRQLESAGYRADRLSVWVIQGLHDLGLDVPQVQSLLAQVGTLAAYNSLVMGELPAMPPGTAANVVADAGLSGTVIHYGDEAADFGRWRPEWNEDRTAPQRLLFTAQQKCLSAAEMHIYQQHVKAAEEADEDFNGSFS